MPQLLQTVEGPFLCWHDIIGRALAAGQWWDHQIKPFIDEADRTGVAIDLGANIGWFTVYLAKRFQGVIALEAHPATYALLLANLDQQEVREKVFAWQFAAYDSTQRLHTADGTMLTWPVPDLVKVEEGASSLAFVPLYVGGGELEVYSVPVDTLVPRSARVTLIKCDVQGCDLRALKGLRETIVRCRPLIIFEFEEAMSLWHGDAWQGYVDFFEELSYTLQRIEGSWDFVARSK